MLRVQEINRSTDLSDEGLLTAIAGGDVRAIETLYTRYHHLFYALAYRVVADHQVAEDLLQEAFMAVWKRSSTYSPQLGAAKSWLVSIIHHKAIDHLRKMRRRSVVQEAPLEQVDLDETTATADVWDTAWSHIQNAQVRAALMKIPAEQRRVIELAYFEGWTHSEIAQGTHIPLGTVKARMRLGLGHLKPVLVNMGLNERENRS